MKKTKGDVLIFKKIIIFLIFFLSIFTIKINAGDSKNILILCSYNSENDWENSLLNGIRNYYKNIDNVNLKYEFLDIASYNNYDYYNEILKLLELKYSNYKLDSIITIDDEAFEFVKANLFNDNSFFYKKNIFFIGLNSTLSLSESEKYYISGILDTQSGYISINLMADCFPKLTDIYVLLDENIYSKSFKNSIKSNKNLLKEQSLNIHYIQSNYLDNIIQDLKNINDKTSAILCCGSFYINNNKEFDTNVVMNKIKENTNCPIFSPLKDYLKYGSIGGYINSGPQIGYQAAKHSYDIIQGVHNNAMIYDYNTLLDECIMNFKLIRKYNINPRILPSNTIYIEKSKFALPFTKGIAALIWTSIILFIILFIALIVAYLKIKTKHKKALYKLNYSEEREKIKTDFLIILSHELRTPLNIILNTSKLLIDRCEKDDFDTEFFYKRIIYITNNANRLLRSINNTIDVAKLDSNVYDVNYSMVNIVTVIDDIVDIVAQFASDYDIEIIFNPEKEEIYTAIDIEKIEKIFLNLISNSIKNIPASGSIYITCKDDKSNIYISIEDNGRGMTEEIKNHIFEKFFHSPFSGLSRSTEGSGIGLYIVKNFVEILDGKISVESTLGVGTIFHIIIPKKEVDKIDTASIVNSHDRINSLTSLEFADISKRK